MASLDRLCRYSTAPVAASMTDRLSCCVLGHGTSSSEPRAAPGREQHERGPVGALRGRDACATVDTRRAIAAAELILGTTEATRMPCTGDPVTLTRRPSPVTFARSPLWNTWMPRFDCVHEM